MKILYFHQHFSTPKGSAGIRSYEMAQHLLRRGHQVTMVCGSYRAGTTGLTNPFINGRRSGMVAGINVIEFNLSYQNSDGFVKRVLTFFRFAIRSIILVFTEKYDLVFATTTPLTAGIPGIFARWLRQKPFVFEVRDLWPDLPKAMGVITNPVVLGAMSFLEWASYRSATRLVGLAPGIVEGITHRGVDKEKIAAIPNGCDFDIFENQTVTPWRPEGVSKTDLMAVFAGTHGKANGLDAVLDTAAELQRRERNDIKIVLVGQGALKEKLQARAANERIHNVIFHDLIPKDKLAGLMSATDIGLQTLANIPAFYYGTSPNKFFDYISAGLPVLNNYPGWLAELIKTHNCGFAIPPDDPKAFADALIAAADNREELKTMGRNGRILARKEFDRNMLGKKFVEWLEQSVNKK